jgi:hypothetical protein
MRSTETHRAQAPVQYWGEADLNSFRLRMKARIGSTAPAALRYEATTPKGATP